MSRSLPQEVKEKRKKQQQWFDLRFDKKRYPWGIFQYSGGPDKDGEWEADTTLTTEIWVFQISIFIFPGFSLDFQLVPPRTKISLAFSYYDLNSFVDNNGSEKDKIPETQVIEHAFHQGHHNCYITLNLNTTNEYM